MSKQTHASDAKKNIVNHLVNYIKKYKVIAIADMTGMPSVPLQKMRSSLRNEIKIQMAKRSLIAIALEKSGISGAGKLKEKIKGMPAIVLTDDNPFKLAKLLNKSKSPAPAKAGQIAPRDIKVTAGPTSFAPGPIIGELGAIGIKAGIDAGKVVIKEDKVIVKEGEVIKQNIAQILTRLNINPMEIGINLISVLENGEIFEAKILQIDEVKFKNDIMNIIQESLNLSVFTGYPTKDSINLLIQKATRQSMAVEEKIGPLPEVDKTAIKFKQEESVAQDVLNKLQEKKLDMGRT